MYTEEETMAALEHCISGKGCAKCQFRGKPQFKNCLEGFRDIIKLKNAEVEQKDVQIGELCDKLISYKAEAERSNRDMLLISFEYNIAKVEAIKEFAERLKAKAERYDDEEFYVNDEDIDNLVQEMAGADNG